MSRQQDLFTDLPRGEQLQLLRAVDLPTWKHKSTKVSGKMQKAVLRVIDDRDGGKGCFASQETIAAEIGCSVATVSRAIAALIGQDLITSERPNPWSSNHHRINWTALRLIGETTKSRDVKELKSSRQNDKSDLSKSHDGHVTMISPSPHSDMRNVTLNANLNATTNRPEEWEVVVVELFRWGLKSASSAVDSARERGMSVELVRELFHEAGGDRTPNRWEPGQLANWLTGKTDAPFDHDEALRRIAERASEAVRRERSEAESIRSSVVQSGRAGGAADWITAGITFRKLTDAGFERFATADEREAGERLDEIDRQRSIEGDSEEKRTPTSDAHSVCGTPVISEPGCVVNALGVNFRARRVPGTGMNQRRRDVGRALLAIE